MASCVYLSCIVSTNVFICYLYVFICQPRINKPNYVCVFVNIEVYSVNKPNVYLSTSSVFVNIVSTVNLKCICDPLQEPSAANFNFTILAKIAGCA